MVARWASRCTSTSAPSRSSRTGDGIGVAGAAADRRHADRRGRGDLRRRRAAARRAGPRRRPAARRARRRADRFDLRHKRSRYLRDRRGGRDRGPLLRAGRPRLHQRRGGRRPAARRRSRIRRGRHVDQAQAARRRRGQLRRRHGHHARLPRGRRQRSRSSRPTPSWCSPTTPRPCSAASWSATRRPTACCGRWSASELPGDPLALIAPAGSGAGAAHSASARCRTAAQICSCNNVTKGDLTDAIAGGCADVPALKSCTKAGTSCGSCVPLLKQLLEAEGVEQSKALCEHFGQSRAELFEIVAATEIRTFSGLIERFGTRKGLRHLQTRRRLDPGVDQFGSHPRRRAGLAAGLQRPLPGQHPAQRQLLGGAAGARRRHHPRAADPDRRDRPRLRPVHQDHRRSAHRHVRRTGRPAAGDLAPAGRRRHGVRTRLRQGAAHGEELCGQRLVPLRPTGFGADGHRPGTALPRPARAAQDQDGRVGLRARVRRGARQGRRRHRHRDRLEPLRRRQRRHDTQARAAAGR